MPTARTLDMEAHHGWARYAGIQWGLPNLPPLQRRWGEREKALGLPKPKTNVLWRGGPKLVIQSMYNMAHLDSFNLIRQLLLEQYLAPADRASFEAAAKEAFTPRDPKVHEKLLRDRLALSPAGDHIDGAIGTVQINTRLMRRRPFEVETVASIRRRKEQGLPIHVPGRTDRETEWREMWEVWPVYAGEPEERQREGEGAADPIPDGSVATDPWGNRPKAVGANVTNFSAEAIIAAIDAIADRLDEGSTAATIRIRTGAQPADPDATETGTLLATLTCSDPAVNAGVDDTDGTCSATFDTITDDSAADTDGTATYGRAGATGTGADDHVDGNVATSDAAIVANTTSFVTGANVAISSAVINMSQGSTAT